MNVSHLVESTFSNYFLDTEGGKCVCVRGAFILTSLAVDVVTQSGIGGWKTFIRI